MSVEKIIESQNNLVSGHKLNPNKHIYDDGTIKGELFVETDNREHPIPENYQTISFKNEQDPKAIQALIHIKEREIDDVYVIASSSLGKSVNLIKEINISFPKEYKTLNQILNS